jgi:hypothetical protein
MAVKIRVYHHEVEIENGVFSCPDEVIRRMAETVSSLRPADYEPDPDFAAAVYVAKRSTEFRQGASTRAADYCHARREKREKCAAFACYKRS